MIFNRLMVPIAIAAVVLLASTLATAGLGLDLAQTSVQERNSSILDLGAQIATLTEEQDSLKTELATADTAILDLTERADDLAVSLQSVTKDKLDAQAEARDLHAQLDVIYMPRSIIIDPNDTAWGWRQSLEKWLVQSGVADTVNYSSSNLAWNNSRSIYVTIVAYDEGEEYGYDFFIQAGEISHTGGEGEFSVLFLNQTRFLRIASP
ncbi:MAG TPA: hypothetical protein VGC99_14620 [Candidatus Tectomicrobia bacterium]